MTSLGDLPLYVVSAASALNMPFLQDAPARHRLQRLWNELQTDLSHLSDSRRTTYLERSGHFVQRDDPDSIVMAIEALLGGRRTRFDFRRNPVNHEFSNDTDAASRS